jgi:hypothetical protein
MVWILVDVALGVLALLGLALAGFVLYRHVRTLLRTFDEASRRVGECSAQLGAATDSPAPRR